MIYKVTPTTKQRKALQYFIEGGQSNLYGAMIKAGYSPATANNGGEKLVSSRGWEQLMEEVLSDEKLSKVHDELLQSKALDHLVFPLSMSDEEITELVESVGGTVKKFKHGDTAVHCWFWAPNTKARQDALKLAYDIKGKLGKRAGDDPGAAGSTYNTFIQQNNINPNAPSARQLVDSSLATLMEQTKRKAIDHEAN